MAAPSTPPPSPRSKSNADAESRRLWRLAGMGGTLASEILAGTLLGWLIDKFFGTGPTWMIVLTVAGVIVGMATFIRSALKESGAAGRQAAAAAPKALPLDEMDADDDDDDP
ncbi:MAG: AtpZ/AtpI family protein [Phycisphaerae bacterium]|nr:AtpZ/AtpI family protein [Phycisphaerae bacterium]NNF41699.1 hypothetical protein [Phycisphaerales bacterium]